MIGSSRVEPDNLFWAHMCVVSASLPSALLLLFPLKQVSRSQLPYQYITSLWWRVHGSQLSGSCCGGNNLFIKSCYGFDPSNVCIVDETVNTVWWFAMRVRAKRFIQSLRENWNKLSYFVGYYGEKTEEKKNRFWSDDESEFSQNP